MIETFYNETLMFLRKTTSSPTSGDTVVTAGSYLGVLRPETDKEKLYVANNLGKEFDFYTDDSNSIEVGDIVIGTGVKYTVLGVSEYADLEDDSDSHLKVRLVKK